MSSDLVIIDKYSKAIFKLAKKSNLIEDFAADLDSFCSRFPKKFLKEIANPAIPKTALVGIVEDIGQKLSLRKEVIIFLSLVAKARRINLINPIYQKFLKLVKKEQNILDVQLYSTDNLNKDQLNNIEAFLKQKYLDKKFNISNIVKKDILGGIMIKIGSVVIDSTIKNQLSNIINDCKLTINK